MRILIDLGVIAFAGGMFIVPLYAILQVRSPEDQRSQIIAEIIAWLGRERMTFPEEPTLRDCPCPSHPDGKVTMRVRTQPLGDKDGKFLIPQRFGEMRVGDAVEKALRQKLSKLAKTGARRLLLMLEREDGWVLPEAICKHLGLDPGAELVVTPLPASSERQPKPRASA